jgi:serine/threonine protein kinase
LKSTDFPDIENIQGKTYTSAKSFPIDVFQAVSKEKFVYNYCIGKGGFGKVWRVVRKKGKLLYAMKEMSKARIMTKRSVRSVMNERQILIQLHNVFIVNMYYAFQDRQNLYLVMDYLSGGDLRYHICRYRYFSEEITRFFVACLIMGLEYIHEKNIIHRDIKPENLVLEEDGKFKNPYKRV